MDRITSRKNPNIVRIRELLSDRGYRYFCGEYVCEGMTLLEEALCAKAEITMIIWNSDYDIPNFDVENQFEVPPELYEYVSPLKNSPGPLFTVKIPVFDAQERIDSAIILENVQDPGNIGTVIRTANAFDIGSVVLTGSCADQYNIKAVRASMGAVFRQRTDRVELGSLRDFAGFNSLRLCAAELSDEAEDIRVIDCSRCAFAVGNEGNGLSRELMDICDIKVIIPMSPHAESLNAAIAAGILMWEVRRQEK